jgi:hypothetical protein
MTLGTGAGVERVVCGSLLAVVVRSVLLGLNKIRAPTMKASAPMATGTLQSEPASSNGVLRFSGLSRRDSSCGVMREKLG